MILDFSTAGNKNPIRGKVSIEIRISMIFAPGVPAAVR
jgi:hypothetical protein